MAPEEIIDGQEYYCCNPTIEAEDNGDATPLEPYKATAKWEQRAGGRVLIMRHTSEDGRVGDDINCMSIAAPSDVRKTLPEARELYRKKMYQALDELCNGMRWILDKFSAFEARK